MRKSLSFIIILFICSISYTQDYTGNFKFDDIIRRFEVYLPQNFEPNMPLVINLHGRWETIQWYKDYTVMHEYADTMGYVLVYPQGTAVSGDPGYSWNAGIRNNGNFPTTDDVGFISVLIDTIKKHYDIDLSRIYCCGYSLGDAMTNRIAGELGHRIAAIAGIGGPLFGLANSWTFMKPMPVLHMHGTEDTFVPYSGEGDRWPVETAIAYWVNINGCEEPPDSVYLPDIVPEDYCTMLKISYSNCDGGSQVIFYKGIDMGHSWPGSGTTFPREGNKNRDINANVEILKFFGQYTNPHAHIAEEFDDLVVAPEVLYNDSPAEGFSFIPGRILDDKTIWFCGNFENQVYVWRSVDGGATFTHNETGIPGLATQMDAFDENIALVATAGGYIYRTTDGGATWNEVYFYIISDQVDGGFNGCRVLNENVAVAYGDFEPGNMHFVRTTDKGATWTEIEGIDFLGAASGSWTGACNFGESIWCVAESDPQNYPDSSFIFRSYDGGVNWDSFRIPQAEDLNYHLSKALLIRRFPSSIAFSDDDNGLIGWSTIYLLKSTDGGATWSATVSPDSTSEYWHFPKCVVPIPGTDIIVALGGGVYYTSDLGATWGQIATPAETDSGYFRSGMFYNKEMGYIFTGNGLVLRFRTHLTSHV